MIGFAFHSDDLLANLKVVKATNSNCWLFYWDLTTRHASLDLDDSWILEYPSVSERMYFRKSCMNELHCGIGGGPRISTLVLERRADTRKCDVQYTYPPQEAQNLSHVLRFPTGWVLIVRHCALGQAVLWGSRDWKLW